MFYCESCKTHRGVTTSLLAGQRPSSRGQCELCGETAACYDVPSRDLTITRDEQGRRLYLTTASGRSVRVRYLPDGRMYTARHAQRDLVSLREHLQAQDDAAATALLRSRADVITDVLRDHGQPDLARHLSQAAQAAQTGQLPQTLLTQVTYTAQVLHPHT